MALLLYLAPLATSLLPSSPSSSSAFPSSTTSITTVSRLHLKPIDLKLWPINGVCNRTPFISPKRGTTIAKASADIEGSGSDGGVNSSESDEEDMLVDKLPLESRLQQKLEQKMRMKVGKKIRLRRKKLLRKRRMRKKGRWPPSKMNKLKNV